MLFNIIKIIHILSVISWMAGLLYLPRLFVYHSDPKITKETYLTFIKMENRLYKFICFMAGVLTWISGILLITYVGYHTWLLIKILLVIALTFFHFFCGICINNFSINKNLYSQKFYRFFNEIPTLLLILIIILVIIKPFN